MKKHFLAGILLVALLSVAATTYTIDQLTNNATPSNGTVIEVYDPSASPKSGKYTLTNKANATPAGITNALGISTTPTELQYVSGVTSAIQGQLNAKGTNSNWFASGTTNSTLSGAASSYQNIVTNVVKFGVSQAELGTRYAVTNFSAPYFRSAVTNLVTALDVFPNGTASESSGNGFAWVDVCDKDLAYTAADPAVHVARIAITSTDARISSQVYGGATLLPVSIGAGSSTIATFPISTSSDVQFFTGLNLAVGTYMYWNGRAGMTSPNTTDITLIKNGAGDFGKLQLGGTSSSFPSLKRSTTGLVARLADDSADTWIQVSQVRFGTNILSYSGTNMTFNGGTVQVSYP